MKDLTRTEGAINDCRAILFEMAERVGPGNEASFAACLERLIVATKDIGSLHAFELEMRGVSSTSSTPAEKTVEASSRLTSDMITHETSRRLRRLGLDPKYAGLRSESDLFDLQHRESEAKKGGR